MCIKPSPSSFLFFHRPERAISKLENAGGPEGLPECFLTEAGHEFFNDEITKKPDQENTTSSNLMTGSD